MLTSFQRGKLFLDKAGFRANLRHGIDDLAVIKYSVPGELNAKRTELPVSGSTKS